MANSFESTAPKAAGSLESSSSFTRSLGLRAKFPLPIQFPPRIHGVRRTAEFRMRSRNPLLD
jgi:hypothetical protein